jgi:hypothetical protein
MKVFMIKLVIAIVVLGGGLIIAYSEYSHLGNVQ